ncbi:hypothetical protein A8390_004992 [Escherichia coli]|nr:hypothetical protein [Escherichia coli]
MWASRLNNATLINPFSEDLKPAAWRDGFNKESFIFRPDLKEFYNNGSNNDRDNFSYDVCGDNTPGGHCKPRHY